jgi:DNA-binding NarL/FixJ family response regulator
MVLHLTRTTLCAKAYTTLFRVAGRYHRGIYPDHNNVLRNLRKDPADSTMIDIDMPDLNGIETTTLIKRVFPGYQCIDIDLVRR